jgi:glycosyltransferase involved in cell wall biosynthesis
VPNYVNPDAFPYRERNNPVFTIGRLSRSDPAKYPLDFPVFYEELDLEHVRFRVQAWTIDLQRLYAWHRFGPEWELLPPDKLPAPRFLQSLDLFVYPLGHRVTESWGRAVVEAMLTGCIPVVPSGHQFPDFVEHGRTGFIFDGFRDYKEAVRALYRDGRLRSWMGKQAAAYARSSLCDRETHRRWWAGALGVDGFVNP